MFPILPLITGLMDAKKKDAEAKKQAEVGSFTGQQPQPGMTGGMKDFAAGQVGSMLGNLGKGGGEKDEGPLMTGNKRYDSREVMPGFGGMTDGTANLLDDQFGAPGSVSDEDLLAM